MNSIEIVSLTPDDWQAYRALRLEALQTDARAFGSTYANNVQHPESWWRGRLSENESTSWLLFARKDGQLVGMIGAAVEDDGVTADIISMYVAPAFRGKGVASALMTAALDKLRQNPTLQTVQLEVNFTQRAAVRLYERFGFQVTRTENGLAGDGKSYEIGFMEKRLAPH